MRAVRRVFLSMLGWPWSALSALRVRVYTRGWARRERLACPVISVGNIALGGRAKSPVVIRVCQLLQEDGHAASILSRGYGGSYSEPALVVSDGRDVAHDAAKVGDEPVMMARSLPGVVVAVAHRRSDAGRMVEARFGSRVHVLDDGFQHLSLQRDLDIVCVDATDLDEHPLPAGPLREHPSALSRARVVLLSDNHNLGWENAAARIRAWGCPLVLDLSRRVEGVVDASLQPCAPPKRPLLVSAIAHPERFEEDARQVCPGTTDVVAFRDHHRFTRDDIDMIEDAARSVSADVILTTAKDFERLRSWELDVPVRILMISPVISDERALREALHAATHGPGRGQRPGDEGAIR